MEVYRWVQAEPQPRCPPHWQGSAQHHGPRPLLRRACILWAPPCLSAALCLHLPEDIHCDREGRL